MFLSKSEESDFLCRILEEKERGISRIEEIVDGLIELLEDNSIVEKEKEKVLVELEKIKEQIGKI